MNLYKLADKINNNLFNNQIDLCSITFLNEKRLIGVDNNDGITYGFITGKGKRISVIYTSTKYCKSKKITKRVLMHEFGTCLSKPIKTENES